MSQGFHNLLAHASLQNISFFLMHNLGKQDGEENRTFPEAVPPVTPIIKGILPSTFDLLRGGTASNLVGLTGGVKENLLLGGGVQRPSSIMPVVIK